MFCRKSFAHLKLFQNIQELFTQNIPNKQKYSETLQSVPQTCSIKKFLKNVHETLQNCFKTIRYVLQTFKCSENISTCLATCLDYSVFQSVPKLLVCLETFQSVLEYLKFVLKKFSNICFRNISKLFRNSKTFFKSVPKHSDLSSRLSCFRMFRNFKFISKHSNLFSEHLKNVPEY